jgi:hypothetical protein
MQGAGAINTGEYNKAMKDLTAEEIGRWIDAVPQVVQDAITSPQTDQVLQDIGQRYSFHIDTLGTLTKLITYTLVGYIGPEVFFRELVSAGVSEKDARRIMEEVNQKIFVLTRKREENQGKEPPVPVQLKPMQQVSAQKPTLPILTPTPQQQSKPVASQPTVKSTVPMPQPRPAAPHIAPLPPKVAMPSSATLGDIVRSIAASKSADAPKQLADHEEPHMELHDKKLPETPVPVASRPLPPAPPAAPQPMVPSLPERPAAPQAAAPAVPAMPPLKPKTPPSPPITSYTSDPYREPIDGEDGK